MVKNVFPYELAEKIILLIWEELGIDPNNPATWKQSYIILKKILHQCPIPQIFTQQYVEVVNKLCGLGRWESDNGVGYWFITFPGFHQSLWCPSQNEWHLDGNTEYSILKSSKLGLIAFHLFTNISPRGGGTVVRIGSHRYTARILGEAGPEGVSQIELSRKAVSTTKHLPYVEITGQCGDVMFMHPLTVHTRSLNISKQVRIGGHKFFHLYESVNFERKDPGEYSPIEISIIRALSEKD